MGYGKGLQRVGYRSARTWSSHRAIDRYASSCYRDRAAVLQRPFPSSYHTEGQTMADADHDPAAASNVVPLFSKPNLPRRVPTRVLADAMNRLADCVRGLLRADGSAERIYQQLHALAFRIASAEDSSSVMDAVDGLATLLLECDQELAAPRTDSKPSGDPSALAAIERALADAREGRAALQTARDALDVELRAVRTELEIERTQRAGDRAAHDAQVSTLTRDLENERATRAAAEHVRFEELRAAAAALRAEHTSAAQALAALSALAERAGTAHAAIDDVLGVITTTAESSSTPNLTATKTVLTVRLRTIERWLQDVEEDALQIVAEELADIPDAKELQAMQRTGGAPLPPSVRREIAAHVARRQQLDAYAEKLITLKQPVDEERRRIRATLNAIEVLSTPIPDRAALPAIPGYPDPTALPEPAAADDVELPDIATNADVGPTTDPEAPTTPAPIVVRLMVVLYDVIARTTDLKRNYTVIRVTKSAEQAGILRHFQLSLRDFIRLVSPEEHWEPESKACLRFRGTLTSGNPALQTYQRTDMPIPAGWTALISADEERAFLDAFRAFTPSQPKTTSAQR